MLIEAYQSLDEVSIHIFIAWVSGARWQKVKLVPLVLIFSQKIVKMVDPKQILVIFKSGKRKKKGKTKKQNKTKTKTKNKTKNKTKQKKGKKTHTKLKYIPISSGTNY